MGIFTAGFGTMAVNVAIIIVVNKRAGRSVKNKIALFVQLQVFSNKI